MGSFIPKLKDPKNKPPFIIAVILFLVLLGAAEWSLRLGVYTKLPLEKLMTHPWDHTMRINYELAQLRLHPPVRPGLVFLGGSSMRECVDNKRLKEVSSFKVHNFGSMKQTLGLSSAILSSLPHGNFTVVVGLNLLRFSHPQKNLFNDIEQGWFWLGTSGLDSFLKTEKINFRRPWLIKGALLHLKRYLVFNSKILLSGRWPSHEVKRHFYSEAKALTPQGLQFHFQGMEKSIKEGFPNAPFHLRALEVIVAKAKERGFKVILMDLPLHPLMQEKLQSQLVQYRALLKEFSETHQVPYWDFTWQLNLTPEDFYDGTHLLSSGRDKFQTALENELRTEKSDFVERFLPLAEKTG